MSLTIEQPITIPSGQSYSVSDIHMFGGAERWSAIVTYAVTNADGSQDSPKTITYSGEDFNSWWQNFNSGKFLYQQLVAKDDLNVTVSDAVEQDFVNPN